MELTQEMYDKLPVVDYDENYDEVDEITEQIIKEVNEYIDKVEGTGEIPPQIAVEE